MRNGIVWAGLRPGLPASVNMLFVFFATNDGALQFARTRLRVISPGGFGRWMPKTEYFWSVLIYALVWNKVARQMVVLQWFHLRLQYPHFHGVWCVTIPIDVWFLFLFLSKRAGHMGISKVLNINMRLSQIPFSFNDRYYHIAHSFSTSLFLIIQGLAGVMIYLMSSSLVSRRFKISKWLS